MEKLLQAKADELLRKYTKLASVPDRTLAEESTLDDLEQDLLQYYAPEDLPEREPTPILGFQGPTRWLSNFALVTIPYEGLVYPSTEHAYQAAKTLDPNKKEEIRTALTPGKAKKLGSALHPIRDDWDSIRLSVMTDLTILKFNQEPYRSLLLKTGNALLVESNTWGDTFWGVCKNNGQNHLGRIIMSVREHMRQLLS